MNRKIFLLFVGVSKVFVGSGRASLSQEKPVVVPSALAKHLHSRNGVHCQYNYAQEWLDSGIRGSYSIADTKLARRVCGSFDNNVDSLLGFCRALQIYRCPPPSDQKLLRQLSPQQSWLNEVYQKTSLDYQQYVLRDVDKPASEVLPYCTCTDLPWREIKEHLPDVRHSLDSGSWTLADAYEFLCVYPKSSFFSFGRLSSSDEAKYALCIADSIKMILLHENSQLTWEEIVSKSREKEAAANDKTERYSSFGSQDSPTWERRQKESRIRRMTPEERQAEGLLQEEQDRLYKLDVVRAYLYAE